MKIIASKPEENVIIECIANELRKKGIYPDVTQYGHGFGITVWSINDLDGISATNNWTQDEKIDFMERYGHKLGGANEDHWVMLNTLIEQYIDDRKDKNNEYVGTSDEFDKTKFYLDVCGGGWVRMVYFNPDSNAGGQLVYDLLSADVISEAGNKSANERDFWDYLYENSRQTLVDIDTRDFAGYAKEFAEEPCDIVDQSAETMGLLIQWAVKQQGGA